jgi:hypothetical protein
MSTRRFPLVRGRKMRVTRLDGCGRPMYGDCASAVSEGFISVALTANTNEGEAISVVNAAGKTCVQDTPSVEFTGYGVEVTFCDVDPDIFSLMSGQEKVLDTAGNAVGFRMNQDVSASDSGFALEVWMGVPGQTCSDDPNAQGAYGYLLLPFVQGGVLGDFTIENAAVNFAIAGANTKKGSAWGLGPYDVVGGIGGTPSPLLTPITAGDHLHVQYVEIAPPDETVGCLPLLNPLDEPLSDITISVLDATATVTLTPASSGPTTTAAWVEWGDGTYTYYPSDAETIDHRYSLPGAYEVVAHRGASAITKTATIVTVSSPAKDAAAPGDVFPAEPSITESTPASALLLAGLGFVANPLTAWTIGEKIVIGSFDFHWTGTAWAEGAAA